MHPIQPSMDSDLLRRHCYSQWENTKKNNSRLTLPPSPPPMIILVRRWNAYDRDAFLFCSSPPPYSSPPFFGYLLLFTTQISRICTSILSIKVGIVLLYSIFYFRSLHCSFAMDLFQCVFFPCFVGENKMENDLVITFIFAWWLLFIELKSSNVR